MTPTTLCHRIDTSICSNQPLHSFDLFSPLLSILLSTLSPHSLSSVSFSYVVGLGFIYYNQHLFNQSAVFHRLHTLRLPPVMVTLTNRRVYTILLRARPFGDFFFSCFSTCQSKYEQTIIISSANRKCTFGV
jgi:hypothetical protein